MTSILLVALICIGTTSYVLSQNSSQTITIEPASFTETASYIIFKVGDTYYAKNGTTGEIEFSGTDASQVIQSAINALPSEHGGTVFLKAGKYIITHTIYLNKTHVQLRGEGTYATWLELADNADCSLLQIGHPTAHLMFNGVFDLSLHGNKANNTKGSGILVYGYRVSDMHIERVICMSCPFDGIHLEPLNGPVDGSGARFWNIWIKNCLFEYCNIGVDIDANAYKGPIWQVWLDNVYVYNNDLHGIVIQGGDDDYVKWININNPHVRANGGYGIRIRPARYVSIINPHVFDNQYGISISGPSAFTTRYISIVGGFSKNFKTTNQEYGIIFDGNVEDCTIIGVDVSNNTVKGISNPPSSCIIEDCKGYVTENSGTATIANGEWIPHGLAGTPTVVTVTTLTPTYDGVPVVVGVASKNATHIQISAYWTNGTAITDDAIDISWDAKYKP